MPTVQVKEVIERMSIKRQSRKRNPIDSKHEIIQFLK